MSNRIPCVRPLQVPLCISGDDWRKEGPRRTVWQSLCLGPPEGFLCHQLLWNSPTLRCRNPLCNLLWITLRNYLQRCGDFDSRKTFVSISASIRGRSVGWPGLDIVHRWPASGICFDVIRLYMSYFLYSIYGFHILFLQPLRYVLFPRLNITVYIKTRIVWWWITRFGTGNVSNKQRKAWKHRQCYPWMDISLFLSFSCFIHY